MTPINLNKLRAEGFTIGLQPKPKSRAGRPRRVASTALTATVSQFLAQHTLNELCQRNQVNYNHARSIINRIMRRAREGVTP